MFDSSLQDIHVECQEESHSANPVDEKSHQPALVALPSRQFIEECLRQNEHGDSLLLERLFRGRLVYDRAEKSWYEYRGHYWVKTDRIRTVLAQDVAATYERSGVEGAKDRAKQLRAATRTANVLRFAQEQGRLGIDGSEWDSNTWLLAVKNGVLDLTTGELVGPDPLMYIRTVAPTEWRGIDEPARRWDEFLPEILANYENPYDVVDYLFRLFGYALTGSRREHILLVLVGEKGRNGKDTLLETLRYVLGPLASPVSNDVLITGRYRTPGAASPHLADLQGKRLAWVSETAEGARLDAAQVKLLTGGGTISTRRLYENIRTFEQTHLLCLITNYRPHADADDSALWQRIRLVRFDMQFVDDPTAPYQRKRDPKLRETLESEASGILAWLVRGCLEWQKRGLIAPQCILSDTEEYQSDEDTLGRYIDERCIKAPGVEVSAQEFYDDYTRWAESNGLTPMSGIKFGEKMKRRFEWERRSKGIYYLGVGLLRDAE